MSKMFKNDLLNLPSPKKLSFFWGLGSALSFILGLQMISGVFLAMCMTKESLFSFFTLDGVLRDFEKGFFLRMLHAKGASMYFLLLYLHMGRGMYFRSFGWNQNAWLVGVVLYLASMATAFLGYILPFGNMSFWAATVITNLFTAIPCVGEGLTGWLLGGFSVGHPTLVRFFYLHVILPFLMGLVAVMHMAALHGTGSSDPTKLGVHKRSFLTFHPYFTFKDVFGFFGVVLMLIPGVCIIPYLFMDSDKFKEASSILTPSHIQPEWYFLPAYTVLRSIPKKLGGVVGLLLFNLILFGCNHHNPGTGGLRKPIYWVWVGSLIGLLLVGMCGVDGWYLLLGRLFTAIYFTTTILLF